jgi:O-Antigen ligase
LTYANSYAPNVRPTFELTFDRIQSVAVWLMFASTFIALIEPAPSDYLFVVVFLCYLSSGLYISPVIGPLIFLLLLYNIGCLTSYMLVVDESKAAMFVITSLYMSIVTIFLAFYIGQDTMRRFQLIRNALIFAAVIASLVAIAGYFSIGGFIGGTERFQSKLAIYNRAVGLFKDPNVFSTYIIFPALLLIQGFMLGTQRQKLMSTFSLMVILAALFLAFSRGAWISFVFSSGLMVLITVLLSASQAQRKRIVLFCIIGAIICAVLITVLLSIEQISNLFYNRFTLVKEYDSGETGRFGNQLNSIPKLLQLPLGYGPLEFGKHYSYDPHNVYVNAFSAYGWLGGIVYPVLIFTTLFVGIKSIAMRTPWQNYAIVVFCPMVSTMFQGVQIDTDHWRHFFWLIGLNWGMFAASLEFQRRTK